MKNSGIFKEWLLILVYAVAVGFGLMIGIVLFVTIIQTGVIIFQ